MPVSSAASPTAPPGSTTRPCFSQAKRIASATSASLTDSASAPRSRRMSKVIGETRGVWSASQKVSGASAATGTISPTSSDRPMSSQPSGSTITISSVGTGQRDSRRKPAAAAGNDDAPRGHGHLLQDLEPGRALPRDDRRIGEARHHRSAGFGGNFCGDLLAALGAPVVEDDLGALRRACPRPSPAARPPA